MSREDAWRRTADLQSGVVSRRQLLAAGSKPGDHERLVRRRDLVRLGPGVFIDHTGEPTWLQRAWAAVLSYEPAALFGASAFRAYAGPGLRGHEDDGPIHVAVDRQRKVKARPGIVVHRISGLADKVRWNLSPPRMHIEEALLDTALAGSDDLEAIAVLTRGIGTRRTTAARVRAALDARSRFARRALFAGVLDDIAEGTCSVLEHAYLNRVERPHGLGHPERQVRASARGPIFRDVEYPQLGVVIELDGRADHTGLSDRDRDLDRDLAATLDGKVTARLGWGQVYVRSCETAERVHRLLVRRGWADGLGRCPDCA